MATGCRRCVAVSLILENVLDSALEHLADLEGERQADAPDEC
jgi:hypothetical protein